MRGRLQKVMSAAGVSSRREAESLIGEGKVLVNGDVARLGQTVDTDADVILVQGRPLNAGLARRYIALNKPAGVVSSLRSTHGEPTVADLVSVRGRVFPVGRLDKETTGLLLLTDDGEWANQVTHPRYGVEKEYLAVVEGMPSAHDLSYLRGGVLLTGGVATAPARVRKVRSSGGTTELSITVIEGKKRQIRLMFEAVGHPVLSLRRVRIGEIGVGNLAPGEWRELRDSEVEGLRERARSGASTASG